MMHFPSCFRFPPFSKKLKNLCKISKILPFPEKFFHFHPPKFLTTFSFSHRPQISNLPPIFSISVHFPPSFAKIIIPPRPTFTNFPSVFEKFTCFLHAFCVFRFPLL